MDRVNKFRERLGPTALLSLANLASMEPRQDTPFDELEDSDGEEDAAAKADPRW